MKELTKIQARVFKHIQRLYVKNMCPPSIQELADSLKFTKANTYCHIIALRKKKMFLHKTKLIPVGIEVVKNT